MMSHRKKKCPLGNTTQVVLRMGRIDLAPQPRGVYLAPLTPALVSRLRDEAAEALNGDGSCSLKAMTTTCFQSENCAGDNTPLKLDMLLTQPHAVVAIADVTPDEAQPLAREAFVGCVSAAPPAPLSLCPRLFPDHPFDVRTDLVLSNLCVADAYRRSKHGVGKRLIRHILQQGKRTYLLVSKAGERHADPEVEQAFATRVPRLRETYPRLGFRILDECEQAILMRYEADTPATKK